LFKAATGATTLPVVATRKRARRVFFPPTLLLRNTEAIPDAPTVSFVPER